MAVAKGVENAILGSSASQTTKALVLGTVTAGSTIVVEVASYHSGTITPSLADNLGNLYTQLGSTFYNGSDTWPTSLFYAKNVAAGACTITATWGSAIQYPALLATEITGADATSPIGSSAVANRQAAPGTGTDAVTSGTVTATAASSYVWSYMTLITGAVGAPVAGTGFTRDTNDTTDGLFSEHRIAAVTAATWTVTVGTGTWYTGLVEVKAASGSVPANTVLPSISGTAKVGQTLTAAVGSWTNTPTGYAYQWKAATVAIGGATAGSYVIQQGDATKTITVTVTATNAAGSASATSAATAAVSKQQEWYFAQTYSPTADPANVTGGTSGAAMWNLYAVLRPPVASGTATVGQALSCTTGDWVNVTGIQYAYQWHRGPNAANLSPIAGALNSTYTAVAADTGLLVACLVGSSNAIGAFPGVMSNTLGPFAAVAGAVPAASASPLASGIPGIGNTLTVVAGTWTNSPTSYADQWQRSSNPLFLSDISDISGETALTHVIAPGEIGAYFRLREIATNATGAGNAAYSNIIGPVPNVVALVGGTGLISGPRTSISDPNISPRGVGSRHPKQSGN